MQLGGDDARQSLHTGHALGGQALVMHITGKAARAISALLYFAAQLSENSTLIAWTDLRNAVISATGADANAIATCAKALFGANRLTPFPKASPPSLAIPRLAEAEREIVAFARRAS